jgi:hypothetical protein
MERLNGRVLDRSDHAFSLPARPWMIGPCPTVLDVISCAQVVEDVIGKPKFCSPVMLHELDAAIEEDYMEFVR